jgi:glycosyltransferase involved in cell wall biosynthesis
MVYFEAWASEKPVVALDLPVLRETVGVSGGGLLADAGRPDDLVKQLRLLLEQPELAQTMGIRGKTFAQGYSWETAIKGYLQAYSQIH